MSSLFHNREIYAWPDHFGADLKTLLDYVEATNKQDLNVAVAQIAQNMQMILDAQKAEDEKSQIIDNLTPAQEDVLKEAHAKDYHGTDDDMPDAYEGWLENRSLEELKAALSL